MSINPHHYETYKFYSYSLKKQEKFLKAEDLFERGIKNNSDNPKFFFSYAQFLSERSKEEEAEKYFKKALELDPDNVEVRFNYANNLYKSEKLEEAEKEFRKVINLKSMQQAFYLPKFAKLLSALDKK